MSRAYEQPYVLIPLERSNGWGLAGFIVSLVGLFLTGGLLCPIGFLISIIAMAKRPRGFAIAGVLIGLLGTCTALAIIVGFVIFVGAMAGAGVLFVLAAIADPERAEITVDMSQIAAAVQMHQGRSGFSPATLSDLKLDPETLLDPWGNPYEFVLTRPEDPKAFDIISFGPDKELATDDDVAYSTMGDYWDDFIQVTENKTSTGGTVDIALGKYMIHIEGEENGDGVVEIDLGEKIMRLKGGQAEPGTVTIVPKEPPPPAAPPQPPSAPTEPPLPSDPGPSTDPSSSSTP